MEDLTLKWKSLRKGARRAGFTLAIAGTINAVLVNPVTSAMGANTMESLVLALGGFLVYVATCIKERKRR